MIHGLTPGVHSRLEDDCEFDFSGMRGCAVSRRLMMICGGERRYRAFLCQED